MKKAVLVVLMAIATPLTSTSYAQPQSGQGVQMSQEEYTAYNNANTQTTPAGKAAAFEAYLKAYPNSAVKTEVINQLVYLYSQTNDAGKTLDAADRALAINPNNLVALTFEVFLRRQQADAMTDPAAKRAALDKVATYAQTGLNAPKPAGMSDADFAALQARALPAFESAIADDDLAKNDNQAAIDELKKELHAVPVADTQDPGKQLQDTWVLAQAYYTMKPTPDYLNCAWYATRALAYAPDNFKAVIRPVASYCYKRFHGSAEGYDKFTASATTNLDMPAADAPKPAPKPEDIVAQTIAATPDLATLALSDREFILQYGKPEDADKVFNTVKGKSVTFPDATVIAATADQLQLAVTDDAVANKTADFTFSMKAPLTKVPAVGDKVTVEGTYASYTSKPLMITMSDGDLVLPKKAPVHTPAHHAPAHRAH